MARFHERAVLECGKGDNLLPGAHTQNVPLGASKTISSAAAGAASSLPHSGGWGRHRSQAGLAEVYFGKVAPDGGQIVRCQSGWRFKRLTDVPLHGT